MRDDKKMYTVHIAFGLHEPLYEGTQIVAHNFCVSVSNRVTGLIINQQYLDSSRPKNINGLEVSTMPRSSKLGLTYRSIVDMVDVPFIRSRLARVSPDIVHIHNAAIYYSSMVQRNIPIVITINGPIGKGPLINRILDLPAIRHTLRNSPKSRYVILSSRRMSELIGLGIPRERIDLVYPPIEDCFFDIESWKSCTIRERITSLSGKFVIGYFGILHENRGVRELLRAHKLTLETRKDVVLLIVTPKMEYEFWNEIRHLEEITKNRSLVLVGIRNRAEMPSLYAMADIVVFPFKEGFQAIDMPLTFLESLACRKLVLASDIKPFNEILDELAPWLLMPRIDAGALTGKILSLIDSIESNDSILSRTTEKFRRFGVENFSLQSAGARLFQVYQKASE